MVKGKVGNLINEIVQILKKDSRGLSIQEISDFTKVSRITTAVALAKLERQGKLNIRIIGNCKLHYLKTGRGQDE